MCNLEKTKFQRVNNPFVLDTLTQAGFIQVFVIGGLVTISGLLVFLLAAGGVQSRAALDRLVRSKLIAEAAFAQFTDEVAEGSLGFSNAHSTITGESTSWALEPEGGKICLLGAPLTIIAGYAKSNGMAPAQQRSLITGLDQARVANSKKAALRGIAGLWLV